jgi:hypothetical protein
VIDGGNSIITGSSNRSISSLEDMTTVSLGAAASVGNESEAIGVGVIKTVDGTKTVVVGCIWVVGISTLVEDEKELIWVELEEEGRRKEQEKG